MKSTRTQRTLEAFCDDLIGIKKVRTRRTLALELSKFALPAAGRFRKRSHFCKRHVPVTKDDRLPRFYHSRIPRKMGFGFVDIDLDHVSHN